MIYKIFYTLLFFIVAVTASAQDRQHYHKDPTGLLEDQSKVIFEEVYTILQKYKPDTLKTTERKLALSALDAIFHDPRLDTAHAVADHLKKITDQVVAVLTDDYNGDGIQVFKIYNHGFILKTKSVTVAIDLVSGSNKYISTFQMQKLVDLCDILFITHHHSDHADPHVAEMFARQAKKIILPTDMWEDKSIPYFPIRDTIAVSAQIELADNVSLALRVFPGHQGNVHNNMYAITFPENLTVMHTGDQSSKGDLEWIKKIQENNSVDILLLHCWMPDIATAVDGINPKIIITGHENELGHSIDHREPYWLTFKKMEQLSYPSVVMAWGEYYDYVP